MQWEATTDMPLYVDGIGAVMQGLIPQLVNRKGFVAAVDGPEHTLLQSWESDGIVSSEATAGDTGHRQWHFTDAGRAKVVAGVKLSNPRKVLASPCGVEPKDMTLYQLLRALEEQGWERRIITSRTELVQVRADPYDHVKGTRKLFLINPSHVSTAADLSKFYLVALLTAHLHKQPVPIALSTQGTKLFWIILGRNSLAR